MADERERLIGTVEQLPEGIWRATYRVSVPGSVFTEGGETEILVTEMQATKWLHAQATKRAMRYAVGRSHSWVSSKKSQHE